MVHDRHHITTRFNENAQSYDMQRQKLIPCYDDFYGIAASLAEVSNDRPAVLDLGAGTGLFSSFILQKYADARLTLIDLSESMLDVAKNRFENMPNVQYFVGDYTTFDYPERYDLVISSLSIHHLSDSEKKDLYRKIYSILNRGGIFVNADQVLGRTDFLESLYKSDWKTYVEHSGLAPAEINAAYERTKLDKMSTLDEQLRWLADIGFSDVDCMYKYYNFVVMYARKL